MTHQRANSNIAIFVVRTILVALTSAALNARKEQDQRQEHSKMCKTIAINRPYKVCVAREVPPPSFPQTDYQLTTTIEDYDSTLRASDFQSTTIKEV